MDGPRGHDPSAQILQDRPCDGILREGVTLGGGAQDRDRLIDRDGDRA